MTEPKKKPISNETVGKYVAGGVALLLIALLFYHFVGKSGDADTNDATCGMAAAAVPLFAEAVTRGRSPAAVDAIVGIGSVPACKVALKRLQDNQQTHLKVDTGPATVTRKVTSNDLTVPPPRPRVSSEQIQHILDCIKSYHANTDAFLLQLCYDGVMPPRPS